MPDTRRTLSDLTSLLADNVSGDISAQDIRDFLSSVHAEMVSRNASISARPASVSPSGSPSGAMEGDIFFPNDGVSIQRMTSGIWTPFSPVFKDTPPKLEDFTNSFPSPSTVDATKDGIYIAHSGGSSTNYRLLHRAPSNLASPDVRAHFIYNFSCKSFLAGGLIATTGGWVGSSFIVMDVVGIGSNYLIRAGKFSTPSVYSADYAIAAAAYPPPFLRITDNGTNRVCLFSYDGQEWITLHSVASTNFLGAKIDTVGFGISPENSATPTLAAGIRLMSWIG